MLVSYCILGNSLAPPPSTLVHGTHGRTVEEQGLFDSLLYGWGLGEGARPFQYCAFSMGEGQKFAV